MKWLYILLLLLFISIDINAQIETNSLPGSGNNNSILSLPDVPSKDKAGLPIYNNSEGLVKPSDGFRFAEDEKFDNPGKKFVKKTNKSFEEEKMDISKYRKNQYFGDFKSSSSGVKIICRDHMYPDGDRITVYLNDKAVATGVTLESAFKMVTLDLVKGFNKIDFLALNQGTSGLNTAEFRIFDDQGSVVSSTQWFLASGFKATVIIVKE